MTEAKVFVICWAPFSVVPEVVLYVPSHPLSDKLEPQGDRTDVILTSGVAVSHPWLINVVLDKCVRVWPVWVPSHLLISGAGEKVMDMIEPSALEICKVNKWSSNCSGIPDDLCMTDVVFFSASATTPSLSICCHLFSDNVHGEIHCSGAAFLVPYILSLRYDTETDTKRQTINIVVVVCCDGDNVV